MSTVRALDLNLASRPFRNNTLLWVSHALLGAGVIAFTAWNTTTFLETGRKLQQLRSNVGSIESRMHDVEMREHKVSVEVGKHDVKYLATQTVRANDVIQRKALSWTRLFNLLEDVQPYEVKMVSIRPVFGAASQNQGTMLVARPAEEVVPVSVEGVARDLNAFLDFERSLIDDPHIDRVEPERTTHTKTGELNFGLAFLYYPEGHEDKATQAAPAPVTQAPAPEPENEEGERAPEVAAQDEPAKPEEPAEAKVNDPWGGVGTKQAAASPAPRPTPPALPPAKPKGAPPRDDPAAQTAAPEDPGAPPKFRMPVHEVPSKPLRKRPDNWQPPASPPPAKPPDDGSGERG